MDSGRPAGFLFLRFLGARLRFMRLGGNGVDRSLWKRRACKKRLEKNANFLNLSSFPCIIFKGKWASLLFSRVKWTNFNQRERGESGSVYEGIAK